MGWVEGGVTREKTLEKWKMMSLWCSVVDMHALIQFLELR
jgi:hypothetical protein